MNELLKAIGGRAKIVCLAATTRLDTDTQVEPLIDNIRGRGLVLCDPSGGERLNISQITESPVEKTLGVVVVKSSVATPSLGGSLQTGFTLYLDQAILSLDDRSASERVSHQIDVFGDDARVGVLANAIKTWPVCR